MQHLCSMNALFRWLPFLPIAFSGETPSHLDLPVHAYLPPRQPHLTKQPPALLHFCSCPSSMSSMSEFAVATPLSIKTICVPN